MEELKKKQRGKVGKIIDWIVTGLFLVLFGLVAVSSIDGMTHKKQNFGQDLRFGWGTFVVATDSMLPDYKVDSAIITYKESAETIYKNFKKNPDKKIDITFMDSERVGGFTPNDTTKYVEPTTPTRHVMTHRLREVHIDETKELGSGRFVFVVSGTNISQHESQQGQYQTFTESYILGVVKSNSVVLGGLFTFIGSVWGLLILLLIPAGYMVIVSVLDIFKNFKEDEPVVATSASSSGTNIDLAGLSSEDKERLKQEMLNQMIEEKIKSKSNNTDSKEEK